jgi:hypothetical protein
MNGSPYTSSYYTEEGLRMGFGKGLSFPGPWVPAESICTCPRHKKNQLFTVYVRWTRKLSLLSLNAATINDIYQHVKITRAAK